MARNPLSQPRIRLGPVRRLLVLLERVALVDVRSARHRDLVLRLEELHAQPLGDVPCNVTMEQPSSGII